MTKNGELVIKTFVLKVYIHCEGCKKKVKKVLQSIEGVLNTSVDAPEQKVTVTGNVASVDVLLKKLIRAGKHAEEWPQPQNNAQKDKPKDKDKDKDKDKEKEKEKDKSPPPPPKKQEKEKKNKEKEKKPAKEEDAEEGPKKGGGKNGGGSSEGAKKSEDAEESSGAAQPEGNKGGESSSSGGGKKKKGGKGGGGEAVNAEPSSEAAELPGFTPVASGVGGGYGHMSGRGEEWMSHPHGMGANNQPIPILHYAQYMPPNAHFYTQQNPTTVQNAAYRYNDENATYRYHDQNASYRYNDQNATYRYNDGNAAYSQFNDENAVYAFNDENTGSSCSVM